MSILLSVILPVFLVIGLGYAAARSGGLGEAGVDGLMRFSQTFAVPCLLFQALATLDLRAGFDLRLIGTFYAGSLACFAAGYLGARRLFGRGPEDAVAVGFAAFFSNSLLLGLPITERAFGPGATEANFAIIAVHSPFCYAVGITAMEVARASGSPPSRVPLVILRGLLANPMVLGILLGLAVNLSGLPLPAAVADAIALLVPAAIPAALFGLGGVLARYRLEGDLATVLFAVSLSLVLHPAVTWALGGWVGLPRDALRSAVLTAAMAPGVNAYLFAATYGRATSVAASAVLVGTALSVVTAAGWLALLP